MKAAVLFFLGFLTANICYSQKEVKLEDVSRHVGDSIKVCGKIFGGKFLSSAKGSPTFLNMGAAYPNQLLTIVIWGDRRGTFQVAPEQYYDQKEVCVTGKVELYREKPQIVVTEVGQLQLRQ